MNKIPFGVKIIGAVDMLLGLFLALPLSLDVVSKVMRYPLQLISCLATIAAVGITILIVFLFARLVRATYKLLPTARINNLWLAGIGLFGLLCFGPPFVIANRLNFIPHIIVCLYFICTIIYLNIPRVKRVFEEQGRKE